MWVATVVLLCFKDRTERMFGSSRDLLFIFLLFVAFKVGGGAARGGRGGGAGLGHLRLTSTNTPTPDPGNPLPLRLCVIATVWPLVMPGTNLPASSFPASLPPPPPQVDNQSTYSWRVVFLVPWMWFSGLLLVAAMVLMLLLFAKAWAR